MPSRAPRHNAPAARSTTAPAPRRHTGREKTAARGYGGAWQKARLAYLAHHPLCVHCLAKGFVVASTDVDHIVPHRGDMILFWASESNWQALCHPCHSAKTAREDGGFGNKGRGR
jgi:5-methylcytosine-specific restriction protein A